MRISHIVLVLLIALPLLEIGGLIQVGTWLGVWPTLLLVIGATLLGIYLLRQQNALTMQSMLQLSNQGELPILELMESPILILAGILFLIPGFFTDIVGFLCLIPPLRRIIILRILRYYLPPAGPFAPPFTHTPPQNTPRTLEGEYQRHPKKGPHR